MNTMGAIHAALRARGIDKDDARDRFERVTGERSLKSMSEAQRHRVLDDLNSDGIKPASKGSRKSTSGGRSGARSDRFPLTGPYAKKLQALWIAGWNLGLVRNRDDKALLAFVKRQTGLEHTQFLHDAANAARVIEALKAWLGREGGVEWETHKFDPKHVRCSGFKIASAQIGRLHPGRTWATGLRHQLALAVQSETGKGDLSALIEEADWIPIMNALGQKVRAKRKAAA